MKIIVTGSNGFIGSHLVDKLVEEGHNVMGIDDLSGGELHNTSPSASYWYVDLRERGYAEQAVQGFKPDVVYHLAANAAENKAQFSPIDISTRNYNTFLNVIVPAINIKVKRVIVTSSIAVYGQGSGDRFYESDIPMPEDIYGISKLAMEQSLRVLSEVHGFEYVVTRPHNVYGPRQNMRDPYRNVVTLFMNQILKNEPYVIYGDGNQKRCFTYIDDVVNALVACLDCPSGMTFNIGSDNAYSVNDLSNVIQKVTEVAINPIHLEDRPQEVKIATADHTLAKEHLNYKDSLALEEGIEKTWEWAKMMGYQDPVYTQMEIKSEKIPENWRKK